MISNTEIQNILFLDIETVPKTKDFKELDEVFQKIWTEKHAFFKESKDVVASESYFSKAGIYAEFGKIICISIGYLHIDKKQREFRIKSFSSDNENEILQAFAALLKNSFNTKKHNICGHNVKEFDIPYICRRMLVNDIEIPKIINVGGVKPWETQYIDTLQLWKFGDYKNFTSLKLLAHLFQLPTPKDDIEGKDVAHVYWIEKDLARIQTYCQKDVLTTAQLFLKFNQIPLLQDTEVTILN